MHHIDASIFLELFIKLSKKKKSCIKECRSYLQYKINKKYRGTVSLLAFGEIAKTIASIIEKDGWSTDREREKIFTSLITILEKKDIQLWSPQFGCMKKALELKEKFQYEPADTLHLASASEDKDCKVFVTIEEKFIDNKYLEKELGIKIKHPSAL